MKLNFNKNIPYLFGVVICVIIFFVTTKLFNPDFFYSPPTYSYSDWFNKDDFIEFSEDSTGVIDFKHLTGDFKYQIEDWEITLLGTSETIKGKEFLIEYNSQYSINLMLNGEPIKFLSREALKDQ